MADWERPYTVQARSKLVAFPPGAHWFCPAYGDEDPFIYHNADEPDHHLTVSKKHQRIEEAAKRVQDVYKNTLIFGFGEDDFEECREWLEDFRGRLDTHLTSCYDCVREYHRARKAFIDTVAIWGHEGAEHFNIRLLQYDFKRIERGLSRACAILEALPEIDRKQKALTDKDPFTLIALSEALCCEGFHTADGVLAVSFNKVFTMIQTHKTLKLADIVPASTHFLFSKDETRRQFALASWERASATVSLGTFEWAVRGPLASHIQSLCQVYRPSASELEHFWAALFPILNKLDNPLITECLRNLDVPVNICHLLMQHFSIQSDELLFLLIKSFCVLIQKAAKDFYEVFGAVSPSTIAEQIFKSPSFPTLLIQPDGDKFDGVATWSQIFIQSLDSHQQYKACDSLLHHLFDRLQSDQGLDQDAKCICLQAGLGALGETIKAFLPNNQDISATTTRVVVHHVLELVDKYKKPIFMCALLPRDRIELARLAMAVIRDAMKLDCKIITVESGMLRENGEFKVDVVSHSIPIWQAVLSVFTKSSLDMARNVLIGLMMIIGIGQFRAKKGDELKKEVAAFNESFAQLSDIIARIFARLSDFDANDLRSLFRAHATVFPMFGALVSGDDDVSQAMLMVLQSYTGELTRKEALSKLLRESFTETLQGISWAVKNTCKGRHYAPMPRIFRVSREALDGLCDTDGGILREKTLSNKEHGAVIMFWDTQWSMMGVTFASLENWSAEAGSTKSENMDFARDAMDHAEALFDQFALLKSSLKLSTGSEPLLGPLVKSLNSMVKWLRLRDPYLASTLVNLISKLLRRLGDENQDLGESNLPAIEFVKDCINSKACEAAGRHPIRTMLTDAQKAELRRAVGHIEGCEPLEGPPHHLEPKKQGKLDAWSKSADRMGHEPLPARSKTSTSQSRSSALTPTLNSSMSQHLDRMRASIQKRSTEKRASSDKALINSGLALKASREKAKMEKDQRDRAVKERAQRLRGEVPGEGSGVKGIGVHGKVHTPKGESIMVDSASDSSSEDDEDVEDVKAQLLRNASTSKGAEIEADRRRQQMQGPVRKTKVVRSAKDMRARLSPNMDPLHLTILNWDFFHKGDVPPGSEECQMIANKFTSPHEYKGTMSPLLAAEAWKDLVTIREEGKLSKLKPFDIKIVNRMSVDKYIEVSTTIHHQEMRDQDISDGSIVLLSQSQDPLRDESAPHCLARVFKIVKAKNQRDKMDISYRVSNRVQSKLLAALAPSAEIRGVNLTTMTTIDREFAALHSLEYYDLCDEILNAKPSPLLNYHESAITPIERTYKVNKAQAKAILSASDNDAFTLIQGPPGSGKTKTIVAMVGALLTNSLSIEGTAINRPTNGSNFSAPRTIPKKLLICAPSNAAVDEIVSRLKAGVKTMKGEFRKIRVIRTGRLSTINQSVQDVSLEKLTNARLEGSEEENKAMMAERQKREQLHKDAGELKVVVNSLRARLDEASASGDKSLEESLRREYDIKKRAQANLGSQIENTKDSGNVVGRNKDIKRREIQQELINSAHVVCATLSGSGHDMFKGMSVEFETVIIDEAAQCIELSALIPLKYGCAKCILVGDPKQLPPTVLSKMAANYGYEQSLFVRMQQNHPNDIHLLDTQYRMHPEISQFPSQQFYDGKLVDGSDMAALRKQPWHSSPLLGPYRFFDVKGEQQRGQGHSLMNAAEIKVAMQLYKRVTSDYKGVNWKGKVGVITPYKAQLHSLRLEFQRTYGDGIFDRIEFNTTDAFQGREAEVIIFSCVRAQASGGVGFLNDIRRMNVGLTRAKASLWVLGDSQSLMQGPYWKKLITDAQNRDRYTEGNIMSLLSKPFADAQAASAPFNRGVPSNNLPPMVEAEVSTERGMRRSSIQDVEMTDANTIQEDSSNSMDLDTTALPKASETDLSTTEEKGDLSNGKTDQAFGAGCTICGSRAHTAVNCDNEDVLGRRGTCFRCGESGHIADFCSKDRCLQCGNFGHLDKYCINPPMSFSEKSKVENAEARFTNARMVRLETRAKHLSGGHDPKVPIIRATTPSSAPGTQKTGDFQNDNGKRRRAPSPSEDMSNKKSIMEPNTNGRALTGVENSYSPNPYSSVPSRSRSMDGNGDSAAKGTTKQDNSRPPPRGNPPPGVRRKKEVDPFIKRKPRR